VRNSHGFAAQGHLMRVAGGPSVAPRTAALPKPLVSYTASGVKSNPASPSDTQESADAAV
jgi:hypothetical protein